MYSIRVAGVPPYDTLCLRKMSRRLTGDAPPNRVAEYRRELNMTLRDVAYASGLSSAEISLVERNLREPRRATRRAIASGMGLPVRMVFPGDY